MFHLNHEVRSQTDHHISTIPQVFFAVPGTFGTSHQPMPSYLDIPNIPDCFVPWRFLLWSHWWAWLCLAMASSHRHSGIISFYRIVVMAPTVQPPPLEQGNVADPVMVTFLADTIHKLCDLLFKATLPKSHGAKNVNILVEALCLAHSLATSTGTSLQNCHVSPQLDDINKRLETITTHLDTLATAQPPANPPYAYTPATGAKLL